MHNIFKNKKIKSTCRQEEFEYRIYPQRVFIRNSVKKNIKFLLFTVITGLIIIVKSKVGDISIAIFIAVLLNVFPLYNIFIQNIKFVLTENGILVKGKKMIRWIDVSETLIEEVDDPSTYTYKLIIVLHSGKKYSYYLTDLNFRWQEISHLIEYFKSK